MQISPKQKCSKEKKYSRARSAGFTLFELLLFVMVLGIVTMLGLPALTSSLDEARLSGAVSEVVTALEFAQFTALKSGLPTKVSVDTSGDAVLMEQFEVTADLLGSALELSEATVESGSFQPMMHPLKKGVDYEIDMKNESRFIGVDIVAAVFGAGDFVIYNGSGVPSEGGTVALTVGARQALVRVDALTGKVTVED